MKRFPLYYPILFALLAILLLFENCGEEGDPTPEPNKAPTCSITSPSNNSSAELGTTVNIAVSANDTDGSVANVKISIDGANAATLNSSPYSYDWNTAGVAAGSHTIKATATDDDGATANSEISITITADAPVVSTADVTEVTGTTATSGGNVTDDGGVDVSARGVVWGESSGPTVESSVGKTEDGTGTGAFTSSLTGLTAGTTYYVKAYATNSQGTAYGEEKTFMTAGLPTVATGSTFSEISSSSAKGSGEVTDDGGSAVTARGLIWSKTNYQVILDDADGFTSDGSGVGAFTSNLTSLDRYTDYWVRAYATNGAGTAYGDAVQFKTLPDAPTVVTGGITILDALVARGGGEVTDDGGDPYFGTGLVWASYQNPEYGHGNNEGSFLSITNPFDTLITGLEEATTYYVRAWVQNAEGTVVYGEQKSFTTGTISVTTGNFTDPRDNFNYNTVTIGDQTWMAENLAYLPEVCPSDTECGYWVYGYQNTDVATAKLQATYDNYGVLYNFETAKGACPTGWHLPSDYEWSVLEVTLGMSITATIAEGPRGTTQGAKMKETGNIWVGDTGATNISGFTARPGGLRDRSNKTFVLQRTNAYFWSSTKEGNFANYRYLTSDSQQVGSDWLSTVNGDTNTGGSVRCVKD